MAVFVIAFGAIFLGLFLILLLKKTSPPPHRQTVRFEESANKPLFLLEREEFREKCGQFLAKFNLTHQHAVWADDNELEIALQDETPVVGGLYLALCIFQPHNDLVEIDKVSGFLGTVKSEGAARGILITTGYFSEEAHKLVAGEPIELVNLAAFISYLKKFGIYQDAS